MGQTPPEVEIFPVAAPPGESPGSNRLKTLYSALAGGFGALCFGFADVLKNADTGAISSIGKGFEFLIPCCPLPYLLALFFLSFCGIAVCLIKAPDSPTTAFTRGLSVFAVFTITPVPSATIPDTLVKQAGVEGRAPYFELVATAYAQDPVSFGEAQFLITPQNDALGQEPVPKTITLIDKDSGQIVGQELTKNNMIVVKQPLGNYTIKIEATGYRTAISDFQLEQVAKAYSIEIAKSIIPMGIQKIIPSNDAKLKTIPVSPSVQGAGDVQ